MPNPRVLAVTLAALVGGCSLLLDVSTANCSQDSDCGDSELACVAGSCVARAAATVDASSSSSGASSSSSSSGESTSSSGEAGPPPECTDNLAATRARADQPAVCVDGKIVLLKTDECPYVGGRDSDVQWSAARANDYIPVGVMTALSTWNAIKEQQGVPDPGPNETLTVRASRFAYDQILRHGQVRVVDGTTLKQRVPLPIFCRSETLSLAQASAEHLFRNVKVPAAQMSTQTPDDFKSVLQDYVSSIAEESRPIVVNTIVYDDTLNLEQIINPGWVWFLGGSQLDVVSIYQPLIAKIAQARAIATPRVALVGANGMKAFDAVINALKAANPSWSLHRYDPLVAATTASALVTQKPDVIVSFDNNVTVMAAVEKEWNEATAPRPSWLFAPSFRPRNGDVLSAIKLGWPGATSSETIDERRRRYAGVYYESSLDNADALAARYEFYDGISAALAPAIVFSYENYYDPAYFLYYGMVNARFESPSAIRGSAIRAGIRGLVDAEYNKNLKVVFRPSLITDTTLRIYNEPNKLSAGRMIGAMGPMLFDSFGGRLGSAAVSCIKLTAPYGEPSADAGPDAGGAGELMSRAGGGGLCGARPADTTERSCLDYAQLWLDSQQQLVGSDEPRYCFPFDPPSP